MRLHRLTLTAFGPFAGTEEIDFDDLSGAGLFLIHGPTGAGKTSVLDAVCFALYGQVPGLRNKAKTLHSDHAPADRAPRVELEFTVRGRRFRVRRSPEWSRPKRRGEGFTKENASVTLEEREDGGWTALTTRLDEAGQFLTRQVGMSAEQFCQVALLPQGEFARFLRTGADERRAVLERLFATEVYAGVEKWLAERRTETGREAEARLKEVVRAADRIEEVAGDLKIAPPEEPAQLAIGEPEPPRPDERPEDPESLPAWAALLAGAARDALTDAEAELATAAAAADTSRTQAEAARTLADRRRRHAEAQTRAAALRERAEERATLATTIDRAERAARVRPLLEAVTRRTTQSRKATETATRALTAVAAFTELPPEALGLGDEKAEASARPQQAWDGEDAASGLDPCDRGSDGAPAGTASASGRAPGPASAGREDAGSNARTGGDGLADVRPLLDVLEEAERTRRDEAARLDGLRQEAVRLRDVRKQARVAEAQVAKLGDERTRIDGALDALPGRCAELEAARDAAREKAAAGAGIGAALEAAEARLAAAKKRDDLEVRVGRARTEATTATDKAQDLRDAYQHIRAARIAGMAAELAAGLGDGDACPVCGSAEHPDPARPADDAPTQEAERTAEERYEAARLAREKAGKQVTELVAALEAAVAAAGDRTVDDARAELDALRAERKAAEAAGAEAERLDTKYRATVTELDAARERAQKLDTELTELRTRVEALTQEIARITEILDAARGDDPTIEARADRVTAEAAALREVIDAISRAATARKELADARRHADSAAEEAGFADAAEVRTAALDDAALAAAVERRRAYDAEEAAVATLLADPELTAAAAQPAPDLETVEAALAAATEAHTAAASARDHARTRHTRLVELGAELDRGVAAWRPAAARHAVATRMAALAAGTSADNRERMKLSAYVLAARLEQVVAAANARLARMSAGRYALEHTTDRARGDRRMGSGGLGLLVVDTWTGRPREPATLSGGETFIGSLSLALGLADVVTAEAGGAEIATLFVDEGFGSLDPETLDEVMDVLDDLRDGGRAVGVVSHVAELRDRITARLTVEKERAGSTVRVAVP